MSSNQPPAPLHVVLGAGQIGNLVADRLLARGLRVRQVRRSPGGGVRGAELMPGDLSDLGFAAEVGRGATALYHCMNPAYHQWPRLLEPMARGAIHAAATARARLVVLDNLYHYGPSPDRPFTEDSPVAPNTRKGALRERTRQLFLAADARGDAPVAIGRASDFFGPGIVESHLGDRFWTRIAAGKPAECLGDPDQPHSYSFSLDVADALVTLGARAEAPGREWILPHPPAVTTREIVAMLGGAIGVTPGVITLPRWLLRALGVVSPVMRELPEMAYQWQAPFVVDDRRFRDTFGAAATPLARAVELTAAARRPATSPLLSSTTRTAPPRPATPAGP